MPINVLTDEVVDQVRQVLQNRQRRQQMKVGLRGAKSDYLPKFFSPRSLEAGATRSLELGRKLAIVVSS
jgi:hypothetical protein